MVPRKVVDSSIEFNFFNGACIVVPGTFGWIIGQSLNMDDMSLVRNWETYSLNTCEPEVLGWRADPFPSAPRGLK